MNDKFKRGSEAKGSNSPKTIEHSQSQKIVKRESTTQGTVRSYNNKQETRQNELSSDGKMESPKKKNYIDSN